METTQKRNLAFYHNLGKLFYAIAAKDKVVRSEEFSKLQLCIQEYWLDLDDLEDIFGSDAAYLIEIVFEGAEAFDEDAQTMFDAFITYSEEQPQFFTIEIKNIILQTAWEVARSFASVNKSELVMLGKLELALSK